MTKSKLLLLIIGVVFTGAILTWAQFSYFQIGLKDKLKPGQPVIVATPENVESPTTSPATTPNTGPNTTASPSPSSVPYKLEPFVTDLRVPWSLVFTSPNRALITERPGRVRVVENGKLAPQPLRTFSDVSTRAEEGLMGMVIDPNYSQNNFVYLCFAYDAGEETFDKVIRVTDKNGSFNEDFVLIDKIPAAQFHAGCRLRFGPDKKLYISTGDATDKSLPQNLKSLGGKILRLNADGSIPSDNPFSNSPVYSYGHRNPQGFDWHPTTGVLIETEHGPSGNDGPGGGDEVNSIEKGKNYGWPLVSHEKTLPDAISPLLIFTPAVAPASGMFYSGTAFPQLTNTFLFGALRGEGVIQVVFDSSSSNPSRVLSYQRLPGIDIGRVRDIVQGPDGLLYITTSNQDGRGRPRSGDDTIYKIVPNQ